MDFELNDMQVMFRNMARDFTAREVEPVAMEYDQKREPKEAVAFDLIRKGFDQDFHKMIVPVELGGLGLDAVTCVLMLEEMAAGDPGFALTWHVNNVALMFLLNMASPEQAKRFIEPLMGAEPGTVAVSTTEPNTGASAGVVDPLNFVYETTAKPDGDDWLINGDKIFCSNGGLPSTRWVLTFCRTDMNQRGWASCAPIVVPTDSEGFKLVGEEDKMGHRLANTQALKFDNVRVPMANRIGGGKRTVTYEHDAAVGAIAVGIARHAYEAAVRHASQRIVLDRTINQYQMVQAKIADMFIGLEAARSLVWRTASYADTHPLMDLKFSRSVKIFATETANRIVSDALQIFGGIGYSKGTVVEKCYRDARVTTIYEMANDALRVSLSQLIASEL